MTAISGLPLRKAALPFVGFRLFFIGDGVLYHEVVADQFFKMEPDQLRLWEEVDFARISNTELTKCPAIESDPAVSIPTLDEFCRKRGLRWDLYMTADGKRYSCAIYDPRGSNHAHESGDNPSEAIARAIVAAGKPS